MTYPPTLANELGGAEAGFSTMLATWSPAMVTTARFWGSGTGVTRIAVRCLDRACKSWRW